MPPPTIEQRKTCVVVYRLISYAQPGQRRVRIGDAASENQQQRSLLPRKRVACAAHIVGEHIQHQDQQSQPPKYRHQRQGTTVFEFQSYYDFNHFDQEKQQHPMKR